MDFFRGLHMRFFSDNYGAYAPGTLFDNSKKVPFFIHFVLGEFTVLAFYASILN